MLLQRHHQRFGDQVGVVDDEHSHGRRRGGFRRVGRAIGCDIAVCAWRSTTRDRRARATCRTSRRRRRCTSVTTVAVRSMDRSPKSIVRDDRVAELAPRSSRPRSRSWLRRARRSVSPAMSSDRCRPDGWRPASAAAAATSTRSPAARPNRSLTAPKSSRSTSRSASGADSGCTRSSALRARSASASRLSRPVNGSCVARRPERCVALVRPELPEGNEDVAVGAAARASVRDPDRDRSRPGVRRHSPLTTPGPSQRVGHDRKRVVAAVRMDRIEPPMTGVRATEVGPRRIARDRRCPFGRRRRLPPEGRRVGVARRAATGCCPAVRDADGAGSARQPLAGSGSAARRCSADLSRLQTLSSAKCPHFAPPRSRA